MKALCHVLFYPTNYSSYITTELICNNVWSGVRFLKIEVKGSVGGTYTVRVGQLVYVCIGMLFLSVSSGEVVGNRKT